MIIAEKPKTFVTTIRVNLIDVAKIALFMEANNYQITGRSRSKLAAIATQMMGSQLVEYPVKGTEDAVSILRRLGYGESVVPGRRDYKPLLKQMSKENLQFEGVETQTRSSFLHQPLSKNERREIIEMNKDTDNISPNKTQKLPDNSSDIPGVENILKSEPESESPQLKVRTPYNEAKDISKLRTGLEQLDGAPMEDLGEIKTDQEADHL